MLIVTVAIGGPVPDIDQLVTDSTGNGVAEMMGSFLKATCSQPGGPGTDWQC